MFALDIYFIDDQIKFIDREFALPRAGVVHQKSC